MSENHSIRHRTLAAAIVILAVAAFILFLFFRPLLGSTRVPGPKRGERWNIVLVSLDTTRPDRLEACGGGPVATPALDRVAGGGFVFDQMITPAPNTMPAHASLFTGQNPYLHGVRENTEYALPPCTATLAHELRACGYETAAFIAAFMLDHRFGLNQGFDLYEDRLSGPEPGLTPYSVELRGEILAQRAARWIAARAQRRISGDARPFFLFVHFFDAHAPYLPPEPYASRYPGRPYEGELAYQDACLGKVLDALEASGDAGRTLVWVISDHGESLGEHDEPTHSLFVYDATVRVVSILRTPPADGRYRAGKPRAIVRQPASLISVAPTLLALSGVTGLPAAEGRPLLSIGNRRGPGFARDDASPLYCETLSPLVSYHWAPLYAVRTPAWKYIRAPQPELYDLRSDPGERSNSIAQHPDIVAQFSASLNDFLSREHPVANGSRAPSEEERARLRSLGYIGGEEASPSSDLPDPKAMVRFFNDEFQRGKNLIYQGQYAEAADVLASAVRVDPLNNSLHSYLGTALREAGRPADASREFREAIRIQPHSPRAWNGWGRALLDLGRTDSSAWAHEQAIAMLPQAPDGWMGLGDARWRAGSYAASAAAYDSALARGGDPAHLHGLLARLYSERIGDETVANTHLAAYARARGLDIATASRELPPAP